MNSFQALRRLQAWKAGRPLPRGETLHFPLAANKDVLLLAFVRMGGESSPWGIAWGAADTEPEIRTVPEPRNRDLVAEMVADFSPALFAHVFHPEHSDIAICSAKEKRPFHQLWLPNASHAEMLHHLAYAYTFAKTGAPERIARLNGLGRAAGWLFREFNRPGQVAVIAASGALTESFTFPCEDIRQGHLGYLLAWLETQGNREARLAAATQAERRSISTSLDPAIERDELVERVERHAQAQREGRRAEERRGATEIAAILEQELRHRYERTAAALSRLRADERRQNAGVAKLVECGWASHWRGYLQTERAILDDPERPVFIPSPETDRHPATAAGMYFTQQGDEEQRMSLLLGDDGEMQAEALSTGEAIQGTIRGVRDEGTNRVTTPVWEVEVDGEAPTKLRKGKSIFVARLRSRKGRIRDVTIYKGKTIFTIEITALKTVPTVNVRGAVLPAADKRLVGSVVLLLPATAEGIHELKRKKMWEKGTPGAWLTDARPAGRRTSLPAEVTGPLDTPARSQDDGP